MTREAWMVLKDRIRLARLMRKNKITQRQLAEAAGWKSHGHVGNLIRGTKDSVTPASAVLIAAKLGVQTESLFMPRVSKKAVAHVRSKRVA
jgi:transcriptional regulator with XRE-family HTH domain